MEPFSLEVKNYRCFTDEHPLQLELGDGFTAFIGANNAGKSSALKFFYEFRHLWAHLTNPIQSIVSNPRQGIGSGIITDPDAVFSNSNQRDMVVTISFLSFASPIPNYFKKIEITLERKQFGVIQTKFFNQDGNAFGQITNIGFSVTQDTISQSNIEPVYFLHFTTLMNILNRAIYVGAFRNAINQGAGMDYDLNVGTGFIALWNQWKVGSSRSQMDKALEITETIREMFGLQHLEINAHADDKNLVIVTDRKSHLLHELGSGLAQLIIVLGNIAIKEPPLLLIDEPELNLHPTLQQRFLQKLSDFSNEGVCYATHSIGLARSTSSRIFSFVKQGNAARVTKYNDTPHLSELLGELSFSAYRELGFDKVLLVEGVTDAPVYREFLKMLRHDHKTVVIPLGGDQLARDDVDKELEELKRLSPNLFAIVDSERASENEQPIPKRIGFRDACTRANVPVLVTARRATENYLSDRAIKSCYGKTQRAFTSFERRDDVKPRWKKEENWRIASKMTWEEIQNTDVGEFLLTHWG